MARNETEILDPDATVEQFKKIASSRALNRRNFMAAAGVTGAAAGAALLSSRSGGRSSVVEAAGPTQTDVLNFALNLEYLEATFYSYICTGADLPASLTAGSGAVTNPPGPKATQVPATGTPTSYTVAAGIIPFQTQQITDLINEIYYDELNHVKTLIGLLGSVAVTRPAINFGAYVTPVTSPVTPALVGTNVLSIARLFEDVGITAYAGAAIALSGANLTYAAQILAVEGFHSGALRLIDIQNTVPYDPTGFLNFVGTTTSGSNAVINVSSVGGLSVGLAVTGAGIPAGTTIASITPVSASGTPALTLSANATASGVAIVIATPVPGDSSDVKPYDPGTGTAAGPSAISGTSNPTVGQGFFSTSGAPTANGNTPSGFAFARTTSQVLSILYGSNGVPAVSGTAKGGFFPNGVNGTINTV
jgi:hypothetical protein